jgi:chemotaxis protein MotA
MADKAPPKAKSGGSKPDIATILGLLFAIGGIVGGLIAEGGSVMEIIKPTAAMIVFGGTIGATLITTPLAVTLGASKRIMTVFMDKALSPETVIEEIIGYAAKARKNGIVSLEQDASKIADPFLSKALNLAVDGTDPQEIRKMMEIEISLDEHHVESEAKVFEAAGGYAPTIGIIGAVMGLIQVMKNLSNIDEVGRGIATAFVATIYGVGISNLFLLPAGNKIKARGAVGVQMKELMLEGVIGIVEGLNPKLIRGKLEAYIGHQGKPKGKESKAEKSTATPAAA